MLDRVFNRGHERSLIVKKNIFFSFIIKGLSILINLMLVPLTIDLINPSQYGIWLALSSIVGWFSMLDIGFGNGLKNKFAEAKATSNNLLAREYVSTTYTALCVVFTFIFIVFAFINNFLDWNSILNCYTISILDFRHLALIVFGFFCFQMVLSSINVLASADQKTALAGFINFLGQLMLLVAILLISKLNIKGSLFLFGSLYGSIPSTVLLIASLILFNYLYKQYKPSIKYFKFSHVRNLLGIGLKFFLIQISMIVVYQTTNIIILQKINSEAVTMYNISYKYFFVISMAFLIILAPIWAAFTDSYVKKDFTWMKKILHKLELLWLISIPIVLIMIVLSNVVFKYWIGNSVLIPFEISIFMGVYVLFYSLSNIYMYLINGIGKLNLQTMVYIITSIIFIPIALIFEQYLSLSGIIVANIFVSLVLGGISRIQLKKLIDNKAYGIWNK